MKKKQKGSLFMKHRV